MRKAVIVRADKHLTYGLITLPLIKRFAEKWKAEFIQFAHDPPFLTDDMLPHYRILKARELADSYDRILLVDADVLITPDCPDPFWTVPDDCIGTIFEDRGSRKAQRYAIIAKIQRQFGEIGWKQGYSNAGFFMYNPKLHNAIWDPINKRYWREWGSADVHMMYNIVKRQMKIYELSFKWNHMSMFSEPWNGSPHRYNSNIIHYAGGARFPDLGNRTKLQIIQDDYNYFYGSL